jgi:hypothetical protein
MAHPTARVGDIPFSSWYQVDMGVLNGLAGRFAVVDAESERSNSKFANKRFSDIGQEGPDRGLILTIQVENALHMSTWDDQRMAVRDGESISDRERGFALCHDS